MRTTLTILSLVLAVAVASVAIYSFADTHERGEHQGKSKSKDNDDCEEGQGARAAAPGEYAAACGSCHWAYAPQLLPRASWTALLATLKDHFGSEVVLSAQDKGTVSGYLLANAADGASSEIGGKIMRSLGKATPLRVAEVPYILKVHRKIGAEVFSRKSIMSLSNCIACHPAAARAQFEDDDVKIPSK
ncbi:MAG: diheme cytochrome c [Desulfovibrio sp.]|nr:diheme cytochrome c [Desulfovibrio sp.]